MYIYQYHFSISLPGIPADSIEEAEAKAKKLLQSYAESNDGSEFLANANIDYRGCSYVKDYKDEPSMGTGNCGASAGGKLPADVQQTICEPLPW